MPHRADPPLRDEPVDILLVDDHPEKLLAVGATLYFSPSERRDP